MPHALLIDDAEDTALVVSPVFAELGFTLDSAASLDSGRDLLLRELPDIVLIGEGIVARKRLPKLQQILTQDDLKDLVEVHALVPADDDEARNSARALGASWLHDAPLNLDDLRRTLEAYLGRLERHTEASEVHSSGRGLLVGESTSMRKLYRLIRKVALTECSVLVFGESGTGKELVSRTIHELSPRSGAPFVAMNAGAVPEDLAESELFGHLKGAFTGADQDRDGVFSSASGGTLFLDEVTEMPEPLQVKLLRVLESGEFKRLGSESVEHSNFRLVAACNRDPAEAVREGILREDLFYRIAQFPLPLPPLRERGEDVTLLAQHFLDAECERNGQEKRFEDETLDMLRLQHWPGNVRELKNLVARAFIISGETIRPGDVETLGVPGAAPADAGAALSGKSLEEVERELILRTLEDCGGNKRETARSLGISPKKLYARLKAYDGEDAAS